MTASNQILARKWKERAEKARAFASNLRDADARATLLYAAECEYRAECLSKTRQPSEEYDDCSFGEFGKCA